MFTIEYATENDVPGIMLIIKEGLFLLPCPDWFVNDTEEFYSRHIEQEGFTLKAMTDNKLAAFLTIRFPKEAPDNCGYDLDYKKDMLLRVAHIETCVVHPDFRGNHLEARLIREAEYILKQTSYDLLLGTVHPDNIASVKSFLNNGFRIEKTLKKYGGMLRHIMYKQI